MEKTAKNLNYLFKSIFIDKENEKIDFYRL